jgi:mersacidin/lichenicidin family type 2 lantibiotic
MSHDNIIRAWKDADFRDSLSEKERALLPKHPAGLVELTDADLNGADGGAIRGTTLTVDSVIATCNGCVSEVTCY